MRILTGGNAYRTEEEEFRRVLMWRRECKIHQVTKGFDIGLEERQGHVEVNWPCTVDDLCDALADLENVDQ